MTKSKLPTIVAIFILVFALIAFVYVAKQIQQFSSGASGIANPQDLRITNIADTSFTVSWLTTNPSIGIVDYKDSNGQTFQSVATSNATTHFVSIQNLKAGSSYSFTINSNGQTFDNNGSSWQVQTAADEIPQEGVIVSGTLQNINNLPAKNALIYVTFPGQTFSSQVTASGSWVITLPTMAETTILQILAEESPSVMSSAQIDLKSANPVPVMVIGKSYDFRNQNIQLAPDTPQVPIQFP